MHIVEFLKEIRKKLDAGVSVSINGNTAALDEKGDVLKQRPHVPQKFPILNNNFTFLKAVGRRPFGIDENGRIYSYTDTLIQYSDDLMTNNTTLYDFGANLRANRLYLMTLLPSGRILACLREIDQTPETRALYLSNKFTDETDINFEKVLQLSSTEDGATVAYNRFGFDFHGNILVVGEYSGTNGRYVYLSTDGGESWSTIFDYNNYIVDSGAVMHIHDVCYDPYHGGIWIVTGDGMNKNIFYSFDYGKTWGKIYEPQAEVGDTQYLSVSATPYSIVLGTDDPRSGYRVIRKDFTNHKTKTFTREDIEIRYKTHDEQSTIYMAKYGMQEDIWYGFICERNVPTIICSFDGYYFYDVFTLPLAEGLYMMNLFFDKDNIYSWVSSEGDGRNLLIVPKPQIGKLTQ